MKGSGFAFADLETLRSRTSVKWQQFGAEVLPAFVAEMDVVQAPAVMVAVEDAMSRGDTGYPLPDTYVAALAEFARDTWSWDGVVPQRSMLVADVMTGATEVLRVLTDPGGPVVVSPPVYAPFFAFIESIGRSPVAAPLIVDRLDLDGIGSTFARLRRDHVNVAYLLCNPQNPTGTVHSSDELHALAQLARTYDVRVVADEIHAPLVFEESTFVPYTSVDPRGVAVHSASKCWNLAGLKAALVVVGPEADAVLHRVPTVVGHGASHVAAIAHSAAYRNARDWRRDLLAALDLNRQQLAALLKQLLPHVKYLPPAATYLAWLDCRELSVPQRSQVEGAEPMLTMSGTSAAFLANGVAVSPGEAFGAGGADHVRLNFGTSPELLTEAVRRMAAACPGSPT